MRTILLLGAIACSPSSEPKEASTTSGETPSVATNTTDTTTTDTDTDLPRTTETADTASTQTAAPTPSEAAVQSALDMAAEGYSCDRGYTWMGHDIDKTVTVFVGGYVPNAYTTYATIQVGDTFVGPVGQGAGTASLIVQTGECLFAPGCTDLISVNCTRAVDRRWIATAGTVTMTHGLDGVSGTITDLELTEHDETLAPIPGAPIVQMPLVELAHRDYWGE